jgi:hypothetical protein
VYFLYNTSFRQYGAGNNNNFPLKFGLAWQSS